MKSKFCLGQIPNSGFLGLIKNLGLGQIPNLEII